MTQIRTTDTLAEAERALDIAKTYDPRVRNPLGALVYWQARARTHQHNALQRLEADDPREEAYRELLAIDVAMIRALETVQARRPDPRDNYDPRGLDT